MKKINIVFLFTFIFHHFIFCNKNIIDSVLSICDNSQKQIKTKSVDENNIINKDKNAIPIDSVLSICDNSQEQIKTKSVDENNIHKDKSSMRPHKAIIEKKDIGKTINHYNKYNIEKQKNNNYIVNANHIHTRTQTQLHKKKLKMYKSTCGKRNNQNSKRISHRMYQ